MSDITDADALRQAIIARYAALSPRLKQIGQFVLDDPHSMGVETLAVISQRLGVPASAIVRFAQTFGFVGAAPMQRLLKDGLLARQPESAYQQRARSFSGEDRDGAGGDTPFALLGRFAEASQLSLDHIPEKIAADRFDKAVGLIGAADMIYVTGVRRSFAVAAYLAYSLRQAGKRTVLVDGVGGSATQQADQYRPGDLLIGISFAPYAAETLAIVEAAAGAGVEIIMITDSDVAQAARGASLVLPVQETEVRGFRTLAASMCIAQSLAVAHAHQAPEEPAKRTS